MKHSFPEALALVLKHEGGYVNHPADPGGATNKGVTQATYNGWRRRKGLPTRSVRNITGGEVSAIYRSGYWDKVRGDDLPAGVDYCVFDFAVNSGPKRSAQFLQRALGVDDDGIVGPITVGATADFPPGHIIAEICDARLHWLKGRSTWETFGKGWTRRVEDVERAAMEMTLKPAPVPPPPDDPGGEEPDSRVPSPSQTTVLDWIAWGVIALIAGAIAFGVYRLFFS